jgi:hypothetical protein
MPKYSPRYPFRGMGVNHLRVLEELQFIQRRFVGKHMSALIYCIRIQGYLDVSWSMWLDNLTVIHEADGQTTLCGPVRDQAALQGILNRVFGLNATLLAVSRVELPEQVSALVT